MPILILPADVPIKNRLNDDHDADTWQRAGLITQRLVKRLRIPEPTAILIVEAAGLHTPVDR